MFSNIIFADLIKELLSFILIAVVVAAFLIAMAFVVSFTIILIRGIFAALVSTFKPKNDVPSFDIDMDKYTEFMSTAEVNDNDD